jgi:hypothetical protein
MHLVIHIAALCSFATIDYHGLYTFSSLDCCFSLDDICDARVMAYLYSKELFSHLNLLKVL